MRKYIFTSVAALFVLCLSAHAQGMRWTRDGNGFFTIENGEVMRTELPSLTKTKVLDKELLKPKDSAKALPVRDFTFSADDKKILI